jgi:hypothetical protein
MLSQKTRKMEIMMILVVLCPDRMRWMIEKMRKPKSDASLLA